MQGFRDFIARGNVLDLAVAVIIGVAFGSVVSSLTDDMIMPVVGALFGGLDFSNYFVQLGPVPESYTGTPTNYEALKAAGVPLLGYGRFITVIVNFLILAFAIYQMVRLVGKLIPKREAAAPQADPGPAEEVVLLRDIRDALRERPAAGTSN
jgi:large conductance mechanosensitive channel